MTTVLDLSVALEVTAQLSTRTDDESLRSDISRVRDALWDWREEIDS